MTPAEGFGMLAWGMTAMAIGVTIIYFVINKVKDYEEKKKQDEDWNRRFR